MAHEERLSAYATYACHELHLFLYRHDREFFNAVVAPMLRNKLFPTFIDDYVLERDLESYRQPAAWSRLNYLEQALMAQRLGKDGATIRTNLSHQLDLRTPNLQREKQILETALRGRSLSTKQLPTAQKPARELSEVEVGIEAEVAVETPVVVTLDVAVEEIATEDAAPVPLESLARGREEAVAMAEMGGSGAFMAIGAGGGAQGSFGERRGRLRQLYRNADSAKIWAEQHYYQIRRGRTEQNLFPLSQLIVDIAAHENGTTLISPGSIKAITSVNEALVALAMTDLPFNNENKQVRYEKQGLTVDSELPLLAIYQALQSSPDPQAGSLIVAQNIFRVNERKRMESGKWVDAFIADNFVAHVPYSAEIVISNPSSEAQNVQILKLLPEGAIPSPMPKPAMPPSPISRPTAHRFYIFHFISHRLAPLPCPGRRLPSMMR